MNIGVIVFPGSNCDDDMVHAIEKVMHGKAQKVWHKSSELPAGLDALFLPGGFSYGDYLRCGAIAKFSPIMVAIKQFAANGGLVIGICNGFQILCEAGLLPGVLLRNEKKQFICKNIYLKTENYDTAFTNAVHQGQCLKIPIAHAEGRYQIDEAGLKALYANQQVVFKYCNENGQITPEANINGSLDNIAGICNVEKNVFGMMPHPERAAEDILGNTDGKVLLDSLANAIMAHV